MFGFLKKKLKDAVSKFSKKAKEEAVEEEVKDEAILEEAKRAEKALLEEETEKKVEKIPETEEEQEQRAKEKAEKKKAPKKKEEKPKEPPKKEKPASKKEKPKKKEEKPEKEAPKEEQKKPEPVEVIPETDEQKEQHEKEEREKKKPAPKPKESESTPKEESKPEATPEPVEVPEKVEEDIPGEEPTPEAEEPEEKVSEPEEKAPEEEPEEKLEPTPAPKKGFLKKLFGKKEEVKEEPEVPEEPEVEEAKETPEEEKEPTEEEPVEEEPEEETAVEPVVEKPALKKPKHGILSRLKETFTKKTLSEDKFEELFWDLEVAMLENNVALEVIEKIKEDLKKDLTSGKVSRLGIEDQILLSLKRSIKEILAVRGFDLVERIKKSKHHPYIITFIGVNGSGKTTTLAKIANMFQEEKLSVVMAASDTFRAAAIDQLKEHANKLSIKLISQGYGADPAAVAYDAVEHAKAKQIDVVMIDTAGRLHSNTNLMAELEKVMRVAKPDLKIFIGESVTGNDCVEQAKEFDKLVGIDAIILSKADVDEKGGAAISVSYVTGKPILYLGVGQAYGDLKKFDPGKIVQSLGL